MLIQRIVISLGVVIVSSFTITDGSSILSKFNFTEPLLTPELMSSSKPKRQLDDFNFDSGSFEGLGIFTPKSSEKVGSFEAGSPENFSGYVPTFKVTRSSAPSLGTQGQNHVPSSYSNQNSQNTQRSENTGSDSYSNEQQDGVSHVRQTNGGYENKVTNPRFDNNPSQPKYVGTKPNTFSSGDYKPPPALRPAVTSYTSGIPSYAAPAQNPIYYQPQAVYQSPPYKVQFSPQVLKNLQNPAKIYAPIHNHHNQQQQQQLPSTYQNYRPNQYNNIHFTTAPTVELHAKRMALPILQLQTEYPNYVQALETTPVIYSAESGVQYKTEPGFGVNFDFAKTKNNNHRSGTDTPFLAPHNAGPVQVLPLQTSSSTAEFPRFKGASVSQHPQYPGRGFSKIPNDYQEFKSQPQLHFDRNVNNKPKSSYDPTPHSRSEKIKEDVEIIKKKTKKAKAKPPKPVESEDESREDDTDEGYRGDDSYLPKNEDEDFEEESRKSSKEPELEGDFVPSKSYPFKEYDSKFNKHKKGSSRDVENDDDDEDDDTNVNLAARFRYDAKSEDDDDGDDRDDSSEDEKKSKFKSYEKSSRHNSDEDDDDEDEPHKQIKKEKVTNTKNLSAKKLKVRDRGSKEHHGKRHYKPKNSQYQFKDHSDSDESRSFSDFPKPESSKKVRHRTYRDKTSELSTEPSLLQLAANRKPIRQSRKTKGETQPKQDPFKLKRRSTFSTGFWDDDSFGMKFDNFGDDENRSSHSKEEAEGTETRVRISHPSTSTPEFTTRQPHKTSFTKGTMDLFDSLRSSSTISPHFSLSSTKKMRPTSGNDVNKLSRSRSAALMN